MIVDPAARAAYGAAGARAIRERYTAENHGPEHQVLYGRLLNARKAI